MKKQILKLGLRKENVSDLSNLRGGKSIFDGDSEAGLCGPGYERTILHDTTCDLYCGLHTYEIITCPSATGGGAQATQGGETC